MHLSVLAYDQVTVCIATKEFEYAYLFMSSFFGGGGEKGDMKD